MRVIAAVLFLLTLTAEHARACSLPEGHDVRDDYEKADYVFRALATRTEIAGISEESGVYLIRVYYEPKEILKGDPDPTGYLASYSGYIGGCAVPILVGEQYLFVVTRIKIDAGNPENAETIFFRDAVGVFFSPESKHLPLFDAALDEAMAPVRAWAGSRSND